MQQTPDGYDWRLGIERDDTVQFVYDHDDDPVNGPVAATGRVLQVGYEDHVTPETPPEEIDLSSDVGVWINSGSKKPYIPLDQVEEVTTKRQDRSEDEVTAFDQVLRTDGEDLPSVVDDPDEIVEFEQNPDGDAALVQA